VARRQVSTSRSVIAPRERARFTDGKTGAAFNVLDAISADPGFRARIHAEMRFSPRLRPAQSAP
jgi:hypothetical protein